jgi:hypothetical protein
MKHVFVETNFIIELVRPFPGDEAVKLHRRAGDDVTLYVPWVSIAEAKRTLTRIINEDLGFTGSMTKFAVREFVGGRLSSSDKPILDGLAARAAAARTGALESISERVDAAVEVMEVIPPSEDVVRKTLSIYTIKSLSPFDEMIMGAVLAKAEELEKRGEQELFFCNLNKKDFAPDNTPRLDAEYKSLNITYQASFKIP